MFSTRFLRAIPKIERPEEARRFLRLDKYWCPEVAEPLLARVEELIPTEPKRARALAEIAVELIRRMRNASIELQARAQCLLGVAQRQAGDLWAAHSTLVKAQNLARSCNPAVQSMIFQESAILLVERGLKDDALVLVQAAMELDRSSTGAVSTRSLQTEAVFRFQTGEFEKSANCWRAVLLQEDPRSENFTMAIRNFAAVLASQDLAARGVVDTRRFLRQIQNRIKGIRETPARYYIWQAEGMLHALMDEFRSAINHFRQARSGFRRLELYPEFARVTMDLAEVLKKRGNVIRADSCLTRTASQLLKKSDDLVALKPRPALELSEIALELLKRVTDRGTQHRAHAWCAIATGHRATGNLEAAATGYAAAEELAEGGPVRLVAMIARQKALFLVEKGDLRHALELAMRAVALDRSEGVASVSKSLMVEGIVRDFQEDISGGLRCFQEVLDTADPASDDYLFATNSLSVLLMKRPLLEGDVVRIRKDLRRIRNRIRGVRETPVRYNIWHIEGRLHLLMEEYRQATIHFIQARNGFLHLDMFSDFARVSIDLIDAMAKKRESETARNTLERTIRQLAEPSEMPICWRRSAALLTSQSLRSPTP